jgi:hypothetical protein
MIAGNQVFALDKNSSNENGGTVLWTKSGIGNLSATPVYSNEFLYVPSSNGIYKLNAFSGATVSTYTAHSSSLALLLAGNSLYLVSPNGTLVSLNKDTLSKNWEYAANSAGQTPPTHSDNGGGVVFFVTQDLNVHAVNVSGSLRWKTKPTSRTPGSPGSSSGNSFAESLEGWPVVAPQHNVVFVRYRLDWDTLWTSNPFPSNNAAIRSHLTEDSKRQALFALNISDGSVAFVPAVGNGGAGDGGDLPMGPQPIIKQIGNQEVAYITWRNAQTCGGCASSGSCTNGGVTQWCDGREDATLGEMVLDNSTVSGYSAGDVRFVGSGLYKDSPNSGHQSDIQTDEMLHITMSGNTIFHGHWLLSQNNTITDRSAALGASFTNPIKTVPAPNIIWRQVYCPPSNQSCNPQLFPGGSGTSYGPSDCPFNVDTRYCTNGLYSYGDQRSYKPGFYEYHNDNNSGTIAFTIVSNGLVITKTNDGALLALENGNPTAGNNLAVSNSLQVLGDSTSIAPTSPIVWSEVKNHINQTVTVTGKLITIEDHLPKALYLGFTADPRNTMLVRIFAKDIAKFPYPISSLKGKTISVSGLVNLYWPEGKIPELVVTDPTQIVVN